MKKIPTFLLALIIGVILEGVVFVLALMLNPSFTRFGPCDGFSACLYYVHLPGLWIADMLSPSTAWLAVPVIIISAIVLLSVVSFIALTIFRRLYVRKS